MFAKPLAFKYLILIGIDLATDSIAPSDGIS